MNKLIINNYYPPLPPDVNLDQRILRSMLELLEQKESLDSIFVRLQQIESRRGILPAPPPPEKDSPSYEELKKRIYELLKKSTL